MSASTLGRQPWQVVDTGLLHADENMAWDHVLLESVGAQEFGPVFRFLHFHDCALLGYHQSAQQELDLAYCQAEAVAVQRRLTGGGAIIFDPTQLGWELVCKRQDLPRGDMGQMAREICEAAAIGLRALGVDAAFRPRNDIEVDGRKISGTGGIQEGDTVLFQGTVLIDLDIPRMLRILRVPAEKLDAHAIASVAERVTSLTQLLGHAPDKAKVAEALLGGFRQHFGWSLTPTELPDDLKARLPDALARVRDPEWLAVQDRPRAEQPLRQAVLRAPGGTLRASVLWDAHTRRLKQVQFSGDFFLQPRRAIPDLEAALRNAHWDDAENIVQQCFAERVQEPLGMQAEHFWQALQAAVDSHV